MAARDALTRKLVVYHEAVLAPVVPPASHRLPPGWTADGVPIPEMSLRKKSGESLGDPPAPEIRVEEPCIYGGCIVGHYGHFLTETLARYASLKRSNRRIIWHSRIGHDLAAWQRDILRMLDLPIAQTDIVDRATAFADLAVPRTGSVLKKRYDASLAEALGVFRCGTPLPAKRIWLSRSALPELRGGVDGEAVLERALEARGWTIVHPQALTITDQLAMAADAAVIAGFDGSAFHTLLLTSGLGAKVIIVPRSPEGWLPDTFSLIAEAKGFDQETLPAPLDLKHDRRRNSVTILRDPEAFAALLDARVRQAAQASRSCG